jgi:CBS domain-containing protein
MQTDPTRTTVGALMTGNPIVVDVDAPLADVAGILGRFAIGGLPVIDATGAVVGVISETDLLRVRATSDLWARWPGLRARHLMSQPVLSITADRPVDEAARMMESWAVHRLIVVAEDGVTPVGILSTGDLVRAMAGRVDQ